MTACMFLKPVVLGSVSQSDVLMCPQAFLPALGLSPKREARPVSSIPLGCCCSPGFPAQQSLCNLYPGEVREESGPCTVAQPPCACGGGNCKLSLRTSSQQPPGVGTSHQSKSRAVLMKRLTTCFPVLVFHFLVCMEITDLFKKKIKHTVRWHHNSPDG